ncbi:hypothetical protein HPP92_012103 [Vanilla planifolia]|uniref:Thioredoxin domain-containing protein n=1 Tax=Vanilla planifolia TaxID=51239 RepID=A0A835QXQ2_VANPL|nr:hypothetical protein HPP92_012543 [Vanilla planifolia]KAG0484019.1 hypothetical protein HPP92_012103 [Vanilla planifolia]
MGICLGLDRGALDSNSSTDFGGGNVHVVDSKESWDTKILEASREGKIVVANFSASWCGPCRMIIPLYSELSLKYDQLVFLTVDVDDLMELGTSRDIHATPTFLFLKDGLQIDKVVGANKTELEKKVLAFAESTQWPKAAVS